MEFTDVMKKRQSVRDFDRHKEIPKDQLTQIVKTAQLTPSWANSQPWRVYIARSKTLDQIRDHHLKLTQQGQPGQPEMPVLSQRAWGPAPASNTNRWFSDFNQYMAGADPSVFGQAQAHLFNASALVYLTAQKQFSDWMAYDIGAFGQSLMLAATDLGIDSIPAYEIIKYPTGIHQIMNIPDTELVVAGIALGYRTNSQINGFRSGRVPTNEILTIKD